MATKTVQKTDTIVRSLAREVAKQDAIIATAQARRKVAAAQLADLVPHGKSTVSGFGTVTVSANNTYPKDAMEDLLLPGQRRRVVRSVIDPAKVRTLYPAIYEAAKVQNGVKISVSPNV